METDDSAAAFAHDFLQNLMEENPDYKKNTECRIELTSYGDGTHHLLIAMYKLYDLRNILSVISDERFVVTGMLLSIILTAIAFLINLVVL